MPCLSSRCGVCILLVHRLRHGIESMTATCLQNSTSHMPREKRSSPRLHLSQSASPCPVETVNMMMAK